MLEFWLFWWTFKLQREKTTSDLQCFLFSSKKKKKKFREETPPPPIAWQIQPRFQNTFWVPTSWEHTFPHTRATSNSENYSLLWEGVGPLFPQLHPLSYHVLSVSFQRTPGTSSSLCPKEKKLLSRSPTGFLVSHFSPSPPKPPLWMLWILCSFSNINELG